MVGKLFLYAVLLPLALLLLASAVAAVRGAIATGREEKKGRMPEHW
jgi:hypothetical protein